MTKDIIIYFAKSSFILVVLYLVYYLIFKRETFHLLNRFLLYFILICASVLPAINFESLINVDNDSIVRYRVISNTFTDLEEFIPSQSEISPVRHNLFSVYDMILFAYLLVILIILIHTLRDLLKITTLGRKKESYWLGNLKVINTPGIVTAFSFFNRIFIDKTNLNDQEIEKIIDHEKVHFRYLHTVDLIIVQLFILVHWFNPFVYLLRNAFKEVHEFQADKAVTQNQDDKLDYQQLLIKKVELRASLALTNNFNSLTLKRIKMMAKNKSNRFKLLNLIIIVPILVFISINLNSAVRAEYGGFLLGDTIVYIEKSEDTNRVEMMNSTSLIMNKETGSLMVTGRILAVQGDKEYLADTLKYLDSGWAYIGDVVVTDKSDPNFVDIPRILPVNRKLISKSYERFTSTEHPFLTKHKVSDGYVFEVPIGSYVYSTAGGRATMVETDTEKYGNFVVIEHAEGYSTLYGNLSKINVKLNKEVHLGQEIGVVGTSESSPNPHVYFEIIKDGITCSPRDFFPGKKK